MISNFSEVEKSLKRCLKEKVSITAATVVGFLIAGTVAFGSATPTDVTVTGDGSSEKITITGVNSATDITGRSSGKLTVEELKGETGAGKSLEGLLTVDVDANKVATITGNYAQEGTYLNTLTITSGNAQGVTFLSTDENVTSITSDLKVEVTGVDGKPAIAMEAAGTEQIVTNAGTIDVKDYAVGMSAKNGGTAVNNADKTITVNGTNKAIGMSATTEAGKTTTLTNNGTITVTKGIGISVDGDGTANVVVGTIDVKSDQTGIKVAGSGTTTITGGEIKVAANDSGTSKGIDATGNVTLENIDITFADDATGKGIVYTGGSNKATAKITTKDMSVTGNGSGQGATGIDATMSGVANSTLDITTGIISTGDANAVGITVAGAALEVLDSKEKPTTATVTTKLGTTKGTGVAVTGAKNNDITVTLGASDETTAEVSETGVKVTGVAEGKITVNVEQNNLEVKEGKQLVDVVNNSAGTMDIKVEKAVGLETTANLINIGTAKGIVNVDLNADGQEVAKGSLVNVGVIEGTTNVNINKDVVFSDTATHAGTIVKAGAISSGTLNVNLNVKEGSLKVTKGDTAINLNSIAENNKASVKNTGNITIEGTGILVAGSDEKTISLTNQGLITLDTITDIAANNSKISAGTKVNVANYGIIKLENMTSDAFLVAVKTAISSQEDIDFKNLTLDQVKTTLKALGVIDENSDGAFSTVGYIKFSNGKLFTTAKALDENQTVDNLAATLNTQPEGERGFTVVDDIELSSTTENNTLEDVYFGLESKMTIANNNTITIDNAGQYNQINIMEAGQLAIDENAILNYSGTITATNGADLDPAITIANGGTLSLSNGTLTMGALNARTIENRVGIEIGENGNVKLEDFIVNANINGGNPGSSLQGTITSSGKSTINGTITDIEAINVTANGMLTFEADSKITTFEGTTTIDLNDGKMGVELGENGNVLSNSKDSIEFDGTHGDGKVVLLTNALTEDTTFELGTHVGLNDGDVTANGDIYYDITEGEGGIWSAEYNKNLLLEINNGQYAELNNIHAAAQSIHDLLETDPNLRAAQLDNIYSNNIYSETVKMSLDTLKMNEDAVLSLNVRPRQGEFTAQGKFLFTSTDYDREGVLKDYKVETKNTGLLGALEYGLTDTSSVGFAFAGTKQDLDMKNGASADGDAFYFGLYRNDKFNNIDLTTGLGYMTDRVDAKSFVGKDKFDSTAFSGYIQGKYNYALGENLTLSPKARLTVTRFQQDSINTGRMKQEEIKDTMADVELGVELKKGIVLETGKMNLLAGASFTTNIAGKDDDFYRVDFLSNTGKANSTKVKGANLEKNSLKLNLGADVELTNGVFYNGGLSYEFDDEDRDSIGVTLGAGYKF